MTGPLLYSANPMLKLYVQQHYRDDVHYIWCSEVFDPGAAPRFTNASMVAPSSSPKSICNGLLQAVQQRDRHDAKIQEQRAGFVGRATRWEQEGHLTESQRDEILFLANANDFEYWRPLLYLVPRSLVEDRLELVDISKRASAGNEYILSDLKRSEFDVLEWSPR